MGKVLKIVGKIIVGIALVTAVTLGVLSGNPALVGWALGEFSTVILAGTILISIGQALDPQTFEASMDQDQTGVKLSLQGDPTQARQVLFGKAATGGNIIYRSNTGTRGEELLLVVGLAGHEITSFDGFKFGSDTITFTGNNAVGDFNNFMFKFDHLGTDDQTADTDLISETTDWTSAHRLRGIAYSYLRFIWDQEKFPNGLQNMLFILSGAKVYDPRLDDTNGGVGPQRFDDRSTWTFSDNSILCLSTYMLGIEVGGKIIAGLGVDPSRIDWPSVAAQAQVCDENVDLKGGGDEKRYTCNGWINPERSHRDNIKLISSSCGGNVAFQGDKWRFYAAAAIPAIKSRSGFDSQGPKNYTAKRTSEGLYNGVRGRFSNPASDYSPADYPERIDATFLANDDGKENILPLDFPMTKSQATCQRLSKIALGRNRMQRAITCLFSPEALEDTVLDTVFFSYEPFNLINQKMRIADYKMTIDESTGAPMLLIEETLVEEDDDIYAWDEVTEEFDFVGQTAAPATNMLNITSENMLDVVTSQGLPPGVTADQGDGTQRPVSIGNSQDSARDGDVITFNKSWDATELPEVEFRNGGITFDSGGTLTGDQTQQFNALSVSATGFTAELLLSGLATTITPHVDGPGTETTTDVWELDKSQVDEAWDDQYKFQFDTTLKSNFDPFEKIFVPTDTTFGFYFNDGGGFVQRGTRTLTSDGGSSSNTALNQTKTMTVDGIGQIAGKEFKVLIESGPVGSHIDNLDSVSYSTAATAPTTIDATPVEVSPVPFVVKGGLDSV